MKVTVKFSPNVNQKKNAVEKIRTMGHSSCQNCTYVYQKSINQICPTLVASALADTFIWVYSIRHLLTTVKWKNAQFQYFQVWADIMFPRKSVKNICESIILLLRGNYRR